MYKIHELKGHIQSIYIIEYPDKLLLLDCGSRPDLYKIIYFIETKLKREIGDLKLALVSHMHPDHAGLTKILQKKYHIPIAIHPYALKWYKGIGGNFQHILDVVFAWYVAIKKGNPIRSMWYSTNFKADYLVQEGDVLPGFEDWTVLFTPGHTAHDISFYHKATQTIYLADVILKVNNKFFLPIPVTIPTLMKKTLNKLSSINIKQILLAHGGIIQVENKSTFFKKLLKQVYQKKRPMIKIFSIISHFPACIRNWDKCD